MILTNLSDNFLSVKAAKSLTNMDDSSIDVTDGKTALRTVLFGCQGDSVA